jgi:uncharacterized phage protein (TIGR01671 family)
MSRDIKFRFWTGLNMINHTELCNDKYTIAQLSSPLYVPLQYIGHEDKNRKEIYDGDIVKVGGLIEVVLYVKGILCCYSSKIYGEINEIQDELEENGINVSFLNYFEAYEVIGNIYENPELLTKNKDK